MNTLGKWSYFAVLAATTAVFAADAPKAGNAKPASEKKEEKPKLVATDADKAGPDFKIQGEYAGQEMGVQVIARGDGRFHIVAYPGGLPGAGSDGKNRSEGDAKTDNGKVSFALKGKAGLSGEIDGDKITAKTSAGQAMELKKVMRQSPTLGAKPPQGAVVLFDGSNADAWEGGKIDSRGLLAVGTKTKQKFGDCSLHVEFILPYQPFDGGQGRGNSGVYLQNRYEVQVLDSFGLKGEDNECGGVYKNAAPSVNMCLPPLQWQTYDIDFTAAKFNGEQKTQNARLTVKHNGVTIHNNIEIKGATGGGEKETSAPGPLFLQNHGNPVFYRNIWIVPKN